MGTSIRSLWETSEEAPRPRQGQRRPWPPWPPCNSRPALLFLYLFVCFSLPGNGERCQKLLSRHTETNPQQNHLIPKHPWAVQPIPEGDQWKKNRWSDGHEVSWTTLLVDGPLLLPNAWWRKFLLQIWIHLSNYNPLDVKKHTVHRILCKNFESSVLLVFVTFLPHFFLLLYDFWESVFV